MADWIRLHRVEETDQGPRETGEVWHVNLDEIPFVEESRRTVMGAHAIATTTAVVLHVRTFGEDGRPVRVEAKGMDAERVLRVLEVRRRELADEMALLHGRRADAADLAHLMRHGSTPADMASECRDAA